jgi:hypothetical protein
MAFLSSTSQACGLTGVQSRPFMDGSNLIKFLIRIRTLHLDPRHLGRTSSMAAPISDPFALTDEAHGETLHHILNG